MDIYAPHSLIMRHILYIMLTTVCNIGSVVLQKKSTDRIPEHGFLNDYTVFRCSVDGKTNRSVHVELWRNDGTNGAKLIISERSRNNKYSRFTTTTSGFRVHNGSNSTHLRATVKAQCTHSDTYSCKNIHGSSFDMTRFEVVKRASKPNITVLYHLPPYIAVCNGKEDPICTNCTHGVTTKVPREKDVKFLCNAELSTARGGVYRFDWRYFHRTSKQEVIMFYSFADKKRMNGSRNSGTCAPRKAVGAEFSYRYGGMLGIVNLYCRLRYRVGSLRQLTMSSLKICVSDIAENGRSPKAVEKKDWLERTTATIYAIPQKVFENDVAPFQCFIKGPANRTARIDISVSPNKTELSRSVASVQIDRKSYSPLAKNSRFTIGYANHSYLFAAIKGVQCKDTNYYLCEYTMDGQPTAKSDLIRFEVIQRSTKPRLVVHQSSHCDPVRHEDPVRICRACTGRRVPVKASLSGVVKIKCSFDIAAARGQNFKFQWHYTDQKGYWRSGTKYSRTTNDSVSSGIFKPGTCGPGKRMWSILNLPGLKNRIVQVRCQVLVSARGLIYAFNDSLEICVLDPWKLKGRLPPWELKGASKKAGYVGMIVGIVVSVMAVFAAVVFIISYRRRQNTKDADEKTPGTDASDINHREDPQRRTGEDVTPSVSRRSRTSKNVTPSESRRSRATKVVIPRGSRRSRNTKNEIPSGFRKRRTEKDVTPTFSSKSRPSKRSTRF